MKSLKVGIVNFCAISYAFTSSLGKHDHLPNYFQATEINVIDTSSAKSVESQKSIEMLRNKAKEYASANAMGVKS